MSDRSRSAFSDYMVSFTKPLSRFWAFGVLVLAGGYNWTAAGFLSHQISAAMGAYFFVKEAMLLFLPAVLAAFVANRKLTITTKLLLMTIVVAFYMFYVSSWIHYTLFGAFLGSESLRMFAMFPRQLLEHALSFANVQLLWGALGTGLLSAGAYLLLVHRKALPRWVDSLLAALMLGTVGIFLAYQVYGMVTGAKFISNRNAGGPLTYLVVEPNAWTEALTDSGAGEPRSTVSPPVIPLSDYLAEVNSGSFRKLNVLLIVIESLRPDVFQVLGGERPVMPFLDSLVSYGAVFSRAYAQSSHSNYADVAIVSGQYPLRSTRPFYYPENYPFPRLMLQDVLHPLGYRSAIFSSQKEHWGGMINYIDTGNFDVISHAGNFSGPLRSENIYLGETESKWSQYKAHFDRLNRAGKIDDSVTIDAARRWIDQHKESNFYIYMNLQNSHLPYYVPESFEREFFVGDADALKKLQAGDVRALTIAEMESAYWDSLRHVDSLLEDLILHLKDENLLDETILVITGDTATSFYTTRRTDDGLTRFLGNGGELLDEVLHVPLFIIAPDRQAQRHDAPVQHIDIMPTVFDALGLPRPPSLQGRNLFSVDTTLKSPLFHVAQTPAASETAVTLGDWRLVNGKQRGEIFMEFIGQGAPETSQDNGSATELLKLLRSWERSQLTHYMDTAKASRFHPPIMGDAAQPKIE